MCFWSQSLYLWQDY